MYKIKKGKNRFYIGESETNLLAQIHFIPNGQHQIIVNHTEVSDELGGKGIGTKLVEKIVQYAREEDKEIVAVCPFVKDKIQKNQEWHDVLS